MRALLLVDTMARIYLNIDCKRTARASFPIVSLREVQEHLKLDLSVDSGEVTEEDTKINSLALAVTHWLEDHYSIDILKCTRTQTQDALKCGEMHVCYGPVISISSVSVWLEGASAYSAFTDYERAGNRLWSLEWPLVRSRAGIVVTYLSGLVNYTQAGGTITSDEIATAQALVGSKYKLAVLNTIGYLYENREGQSVPSKYEAQAKLNVSGAPASVDLLMTGESNMSLTGKSWRT